MVERHYGTSNRIWIMDRGMVAEEERALAHISVCFLAYVLCKTLAALSRQAGLGDEPRRVHEELAEIRSMMSSCPPLKE